MMILGDALMVGLCYALVTYWLHGVNVFFPPSRHFIPVPIVVMIWTCLLHFFKMYESFRVKELAETFFIIFKAAVAGFVLLSFAIYITKLVFVTRSDVVAVSMFASLVLAFEKTALMFFFRYSRHRGFNFKNVLIVGTGKRAQRFMDMIHTHSQWGYRIIGLVDDESKIGHTVSGHPVIGSLKDVPNIIHNNVVDDIVFIVPRGWLGRIEGIIQFCEIEGIRVNVAVDHFELKISRARQADLHGFPLIVFESAPDKVWHLLFKRWFDILLTLLTLAVFWPLFVSIALLVKATSRGPILFKQERLGLNGRKFMLYKFRTMVQDAEKILDELRKHNEMSGPVFKMAKDPRLTQIGTLLRKFSLDELPQLWNVLKGDMSLVGPRPPIPSEVSKYDSWHRRRLSMRPGLTCLWQVNGRNKITDFDDWMKLDLEYIDNWSLFLDCMIILKTVPAVFLGVGAK